MLTHCPRGVQVLYLAPDPASAAAFEAMLEEFGLREFATNLSNGPDALRCLRQVSTPRLPAAPNPGGATVLNSIAAHPLGARRLRQRYARLRELAGSQKASGADAEAADRVAAFKMHHQVLARAKARLEGTAGASGGPPADSGAQLSLRQFLEAQVACMRSAKEMVAMLCENKLLRAAKTLTGGQRPELAAACCALLTTDSTDDFVVRSAEFASLVLLLSPIVIATPPDLAVWLASPPSSSGPVFDTALLDDASKLQPHELARALLLSGPGVVAVGSDPPSTVLSRLRKRSGGAAAAAAAGKASSAPQHANGYELIVAASAGHGKVAACAGVHTTGNYSSKTADSAKDSAPRLLLPIPSQLDRALGSRFIRLDDGTGTGAAAATAGSGMLKRSGRSGSSAKRSEARLGNNMDSAIKAVQAALGTPHRALAPEAIEPLRPHLRALRGGVVNIGEARDIAAEVAKIGRAIPGAKITIVAMSTAQMHLLQAVCTAAPAATKARAAVHVCTIFELGATCRCDVLMLSATYGLRSSIKNARGVSSQRLPGIIAAITELSRLQSVIFLSGGTAAAWADTKPSTSFAARFGKALVKMSRPLPEDSAAVPPAAQWTVDLHETLKATTFAEDGSCNDDDWRLVSARQPFFCILCLFAASPRRGCVARPLRIWNKCAPTMWVFPAAAALPSVPRRRRPGHRAQGLDRALPRQPLQVGADDGGEHGPSRMLSPLKPHIILPFCSIPAVCLMSVSAQERFCVLPELLGRWRWRSIHHVFAPSPHTHGERERHCLPLQFCWSSAED